LGRPSVRLTELPSGTVRHTTPSPIIAIPVGRAVAAAHPDTAFGCPPPAGAPVRVAIRRVVLVAVMAASISVSHYGSSFTAILPTAATFPPDGPPPYCPLPPLIFPECAGFLEGGTKHCDPITIAEFDSAHSPHLSRDRRRNLLQKEVAFGYQRAAPCAPTRARREAKRTPRLVRPWSEPVSSVAVG
jgi:hypothetical protein